MSPSSAPVVVVAARRSLRALGAALLVVAVVGFYAVGSLGPGCTVRLQPRPDDDDDVGGGGGGGGARPADGYLVATPRCHIPDVDPRHASIRKYLHAGERIGCARLAPLTYTSVDDDGRHTLHIDPAMLVHYAGAAGAVSCCYSVVKRVSDTKNNESSCVAFASSAALTASTELVYVLCSDRRGKKTYANLHAVVRRPAPSPPRAGDTPPSLAGDTPPSLAGETPSPRAGDTPSPRAGETPPPRAGETPPPRVGETPPSPRRPSVLLLGIDSLSRLNMLRSMPRTVQHLRAQGWLEMRGYNKVGDNTIPNLMAVLTGLNMAQLRDLACALPQAAKRGYDHCPFIWKQFKRAGYATSYLEDEHLLSTFNYKSAGFQRAPTDYYLHPLMVEAVKKLAVRKTDGLLTCLEATRTTDHFLKFTLDLMAAFNAAALFAVVWLNNFSHNNYNTPAVMDVPLFEFFQELTASEALNNTLVVFLSDHGARFGKLRETYVGWLEERLPFLYVWVPPWFRAQHPRAYANMAAHAGRLTSPFDLHLTLKDLLGGGLGVGLGGGNGSAGCPTCASLFAPPAEDRSCDEAGISTHWCTCVSQEPTSTSGAAVLGAVQAALDDINAQLAQLGNSTPPCAHLALNQVFSARVSKRDDDKRDVGKREVTKQQQHDVTKHDVTKKKEGDVTKHVVSKKQNGDVGKHDVSKQQQHDVIKNDVSNKHEGDVTKHEVSKKQDGDVGKSDVSKQQDGDVGKSDVSKHGADTHDVMKRDVGKQHAHDDYAIVFDTVPGGAVLDATVRVWDAHGSAARRFQVMGMVSRINSIGADGRCIDDKDLQLYCYCLK